MIIGVSQRVDGKIKKQTDKQTLIKLEWLFFNGKHYGCKYITTTLLYIYHFPVGIWVSRAYLYHPFSVEF